MTHATAVRAASDFTELSRAIKAARLLDRRRGNYAIRIGLTLTAFAGAWWVFVVVGDSWYQTIVGAVIGLLFTQIAFLGHDGGHQQVFRSRRVNDVLGLITGNLLVGLSFGWWIDEHNQHHANPNHEGRDPDIGDSVITFTDDQCADTHGKVKRFIAAHQGWLFFPLLTLEGINLHVQAFEWLRSATVRRYRRTELALLALHGLGLLTVTFLVLSPIKAVVFVAIIQGVWGVYMGCSFAPNHKGMPTIPPNMKLDFLRKQVLTTRNIRGGPFVDFVFGGLNYQVEHHLFPNMPRPNLRKAQPIVREYCKQLGVIYTETSLIGSYVMSVGHLHRVGAPLRRARAAA